MDVKDILKELIRIPSANIFTKQLYDSPHYPVEQNIASWIYDFLSELGFSPRMIGYSSTRPNVVVKLSKGKPKIILNGHMDTIIPPKSYSFNPYMGIEKDGKIYGVGSADMKGALACYLDLAQKLRKEEVDVGVEIWFVVGEEAGSCPYGTQFLLEKGLKGDFAIVGEPGLTKMRIGNMGFYRFMIETKGKSTHTGSREWIVYHKGENAIVKMAKVIDKMRKIKFDGKVDEFGDRVTTITFPTIIEGGTAINVLPDRCRAFGDCRLLPIHTKEMVKNEILKVIEDAELIDLKDAPGWIIKPNKYTQLLLEVTKKIAGNCKYDTCTPSSDACFFVSKGIPAVNLGPEGKNYHAADEFVYIDSLIKYTKILLEFLRKLP